MDIAPQYHIGLVLGGGGARGFAHLGVIQAMYDTGLKPTSYQEPVPVPLSEQ